MSCSKELTLDGELNKLFPDIVSHVIGSLLNRKKVKDMVITNVTNGDMKIIVETNIGMILDKYYYENIESVLDGVADKLSQAIKSDDFESANYVSLILYDLIKMPIYCDIRTHHEKIIDACLKYILENTAFIVYNDCFQNKENSYKKEVTITTNILSQTFSGQCDPLFISSNIKHNNLSCGLNRLRMYKTQNRYRLFIVVIQLNTHIMIIDIGSQSGIEIKKTKIIDKNLLIGPHQKYREEYKMVSKPGSRKVLLFSQGEIATVGIIGDTSLDFQLHISHEIDSI